MPLYTPGRRRAIILLLLTSVLLLTLDLRGNAVFDAARTGFTHDRRAVRDRRRRRHQAGRATRGAASPTTTTWSEENERLRDQLDAQRGDQVAAQAAIQDYQELLARSTTSRRSATTRRVVGDGRRRQPEQPRPGHRDQQGLATTASRSAWPSSTTPASSARSRHRCCPDRAYVMLITDPRYAVPVKVVPGRRRRPRRRPPDRPATPDVGAVDDARRRPTAPTAPRPCPVDDRAADVAAESTTTIDVADHDDASTSTNSRETGQLTRPAAPTSCRRSTCSTTRPVFGRIVEGDIVLTAGGTDEPGAAGHPRSASSRNVDQPVVGRRAAARGRAARRPRPAALRAASCCTSRRPRSSRRSTPRRGG